MKSIMKTKMPRKQRKKLEIIQEILHYLENNSEVAISSFRDIGLDKKSVLEYIEIINYLSNKQFEIEIQEILNITVVKLKK